MAEIEVLLDFGRPYVRLDDYNEMKERYWSQVTKTQDADGEAAKWQEHARALLARAEAAEAEVARLQDENAETWFAFDRQQERSNRLAARVAELEAQLAAQQWRPVTEKPVEPPDGETSEYLTWNELVGFTVRRYRDGQFHSAFRNQPTHYRPLPPAPNEADEVQP